MKEGAAAEVTSAAEKGEKPGEALLTEANEETDGGPWLLEWFPGFDIPIGLEGRAYLRRLLNHRRAENPAACETLLAAHGIKLGRGVPGHTSNWGSMKVRELLHAAYLLGCWSAVERLCINFCHANGLKTEWIRELKAKGGKQSVTLANLQNYRKKNREKKRPQPQEAKERKAAGAAAASAPRLVSTAGPPCAVDTTAVAAVVPSATAPLVPGGTALTSPEQLGNNTGEEVSCSPDGPAPAKKRRRSSAVSDHRKPCQYVFGLLTPHQAATADPTPGPALDYTKLLPPSVAASAEPTPSRGLDYAKVVLSESAASDEQPSLPRRDGAGTQEKSTGAMDSEQLPLQLTIPILPGPLLSSLAGEALLPSADTDNAPPPGEPQSLLAVPAAQILEQAPSLTYVLDNNSADPPAGLSATPPCNGSSGIRMRRPKRRSGKQKPTGPRKRRQQSARKSASDIRTGSLSSVTSSECPAVSPPIDVASESTGRTQSSEGKSSVNCEQPHPLSVPQGLAAGTDDNVFESQTLLGSCLLQEYICRAAQRAARPAASAPPPVARPVGRSAPTVVRQASPRYCNRWYAASVSSTDSSDNGGSETESLHSRTSTCTTTSTYSDSDHSLHEGCLCSTHRVKQVNFAGKKPASTRPLAEATPRPLFLAHPVAREQHLNASLDTIEAPFWTEFTAAPHLLSFLPKGNVEKTLAGPPCGCRERLNAAPGAPDAVQTNALPPNKNSVPPASELWGASCSLASETTASINPRDICAAQASFYGNGQGVRVRARPESAPSPRFPASSHQCGCEKNDLPPLERVVSVEADQHFNTWAPAVIRTPGNTDDSAAVDTEIALHSPEGPWSGTPRRACIINCHARTDAHFDGRRCVQQLHDSHVFLDVQSGKLERCHCGGSGRLGQIRVAAERDLGEASEADSLTAPQQELASRRDDRSAFPPRGLAGDKKVLISSEGGYTVEHIVNDTAYTAGRDSAARSSFSKREDLTTSKDAVASVNPYSDAALPSYAPFAETLVGSILSSQSGIQREAQAEAHGMRDTTATVDSTQVCSRSHLHTKAAWASYAGSNTAHSCIFEEKLCAHHLPTLTASCSTADACRTLFSPSSATLVGASSTFAQKDSAGHGADERCARREDDSLNSQTPLQLPPLAQAPELAFARSSMPTGVRETQIALWENLSTPAAEATEDSITVLAARRPPSMAVAVEESAALQQHPSRTVGLSATLWANLSASAPEAKTSSVPAFGNRQPSGAAGAPENDGSSEANGISAGWSSVETDADSVADFALQRAEQSGENLSTGSPEADMDAAVALGARRPPAMADAMNEAGALHESSKAVRLPTVWSGVEPGAGSDGDFIPRASAQGDDEAILLGTGYHMTCGHPTSHGTPILVEQAGGSRRNCSETGEPSRDWRDVDPTTCSDASFILQASAQSDAVPSLRGAAYGWTPAHFSSYRTPVPVGSSDTSGPSTDGGGVEGAAGSAGGAILPASAQSDDGTVLLEGGNHRNSGRLNTNRTAPVPGTSA